jgi:signal transduction histidine kinase
MSSVVRLGMALAVLALALAVLVWTTYDRDRKLTERIREEVREVQDAERRTRSWAQEQLNRVLLQLGQTFLLGVGGLENLDDQSEAAIRERLTMLVRGEGTETRERLLELLELLEEKAQGSIGDLGHLSPEENTRLRERVAAFTVGGREEPLVTPRGEGPIESVLVISREYEIVAASEQEVEGQRFVSDQEERDRIAQALEDPVSHRLTLGDDRRVTDVYVPLRLPSVFAETPRTVGVLKFRYRGSLEEIPSPDLTPAVVSPKLPVSVWAAVITAAIGLGFGILAIRRVSLVTRALEDLARRTGDLPPSKEPRGGDAAFRALAVMEERFESLEEGARDQNRLLEWLAGSLEEGVVVLQPDGFPRSINRWALENLRLEPEEQAVSAFRDLLAGNPELREIIGEAASRGLGVKNRDLELALAGNARLGVRLTVYALREEEDISGVMVLMKDLASIHRLERALREASRLETLARLSRSVAHEIKNPLGTVGIHLELLRRRFERTGEDEPTREQIQTIRDEVARLDRTIREFLGMTGPEERDRGPSDLNRVLSAVARFLRVEARDSEVAIVTELAPLLPPSEVSPGRLKQATLNLALNAIQAMPEGGRLTLRSRIERDGLLILEVEDTGSGIPRTIRDQVFELHFTTKVGGSGLGLAITRQILEEAGGSVDFISEEGRGTRFRAYLPVFRGLRQATGAERTA